MKPLQDFSSSSYHDMLDFLVVDPAGESVGTLYSMWSDQSTGRFEFIGFKTAWLSGKNHIVPAAEVQVDPDKKTIHVPYTVEFLKDAPTFDAAAEITEEQEKSIREHYRHHLG